MRAFFIFTALITFFTLQAQDQLKLVVPVGHTRPVQAFLVSSDSSYLFSVDFEPEITVWDYQAKKELFKLEGHQARVNSLSFINNKLVSSGADGKVIIWDLDEGKQEKTLELNANVIGSFFKGDILCAVTENGNMFQQRLNEDALFDSVYLGLEEITSFLFDSVENKLYTGNKDGLLSIHDFEQKTTDTLSVSESDINVIRITERHVLVGDNNGQLVLMEKENKALSVNKLLDFRIYDMELLGNQVYVAGRGEREHMAVFNLDNQKKELLDFQLPVTDRDNLALGIRKIAFSKNNLLFGLPTGDIWLLNRNIEEWSLFKGSASPLNTVRIVDDQLFIAGEKYPVKKIDLKGIMPVTSYPEAGMLINSFDVDHLGSLLVTVTDDDRIELYDLEDRKILKSYDIKSRYASTRILFDPTGNYFVRKNDQKTIDVFHFKGDKTKSIKVENGFNFQFSSDGGLFFVQSREGLFSFEVPKFKELYNIEDSDIQDFAITGEAVYLLKNDDKTLVRYSRAGEKQSSFQVSKRIDRLVLDPSGRFLFGYINSFRPNDMERTFELHQIDIKDQKIVRSFSGHTGFIQNIAFFDEGRFVFTSSSDGKVNIYDLKSETSEPSGSVISLGSEEYVVLTPSGLYDATPRAMKSLHYAKNGEVLGLDQFKSSFFEPNLLARIVGLNKEPLPDRDINEVLPHPELDIKHPNLNDGLLGINLEDRGGGIGRVVIIINGKEVARDVRDVVKPSGDNFEYNYKIANHPYLKPNELNRVTIRAYNADGSVSSSEKNLFVFPDDKSASKNASQFFAIIAGSSDYEGDQLDLNFAAKDAEDFAEVLKVSAENLFGKENTHIALLTTNAGDKALWPFKRNIDSVFTKYSEMASASDFLMIYLSGHGLNEDDFYYLTPSASDQNFDEELAESAISSIELTDMIKRVPALQQVLILDACHSGRFANELLQLSGPSTMNSDKIKALETIKDRTGLYVLAGSKADAVSYEASLFEQGLLTYSILFGMKGAALKADNSVDVIDLFQFVNKKVPELASEIGGIQKPELRYPNNANSFVIGRLEEEDKNNISIVESKPVFVLSNFQEENLISDPLKLTQKVNERLRLAAEEDKGFVYVNKTNFSGAYRIWGRYELNEDLIQVKVNLYKGDVYVKSFDASGLNTTLLSDKIVNQIKASIKK